MKKKLIRQIREIEKTIERGDTIDLMYEGKSLANYDFVEWSIDGKTPEQWLRGCLCFEISLKGLDINKASLKFTHHE
jgi:hypothetical protein